LEKAGEENRHRSLQLNSQKEYQRKKDKKRKLDSRNGGRTQRACLQNKRVLRSQGGRSFAHKWQGREGKDRQSWVENKKKRGGKIGRGKTKEIGRDDGRSMNALLIKLSWRNYWGRRNKRLWLTV